MAVTIHIMPKGLEGWLLKVEGDKAQEGFFGTREEALRVATTMSDTLRAELIIHNRDGTTTRH